MRTYLRTLAIDTLTCLPAAIVFGPLFGLGLLVACRTIRGTIAAVYAV